LSKKSFLSFALLFMLLFAIIATAMGYFTYPYEKESIILSFDDNWNVGSYDMKVAGWKPLVDFEYNNNTYTTNPDSEIVGSLPKIPIDDNLDLEDIIKASGSSTDNYQDVFNSDNSAYVMYVTIVNGEVYYYWEKIYKEYGSNYYISTEIIDENRIEISIYPDWADFYFVVVVGSFMIAFVLVNITKAEYEKRRKDQ